jgi:MFS family permease
MTDDRRARLSTRFWVLWGAEGISAVGSQVTLIAVPLTAVAYLRSSAFDVGALQAAAFLPIIVVGLVAGAVVDRISSVRLLRVTNWSRGLLIGLVPTLAAAGVLNIWLLAAISLAASTFAVFGDLGVQSALPDTVAVDSLVTANARMTFAQAVAQTIGPASAGALVGALTAPNAVIVDAASFGLAAVLMQAVPAGVAARRPPRHGPGSLRAQIREGLRFVAKHPMLRAVVIAAGALNLFSGMLLALEILFMSRSLHISSQVIGLIFTVQGIVAVAAALAAARLSGRIGVGRSLILGLLAEGAGALLFSFAAGPPLVAIVIVTLANAVNALVSPLFNVNSISLRQAITPKDMLGRVNSSARMMIMGSRPVGSLIGGALAGPLGIRPVLVIAAVGMIGSGSWLATTPVRRVRQMSDAQVLGAPGVAQPVGRG